MDKGKWVRNWQSAKKFVDFPAWLGEWVGEKIDMNTDETHPEKPCFSDKKEQPDNIMSARGIAKGSRLTTENFLLWKQEEKALEEAKYQRIFSWRNRSKQG